MKHSRNNIEVTENGRIVIGNSATKTVNRLRREIEKETNFDVGADMAALILLLKDQTILRETPLFELVSWLWSKNSYEELSIDEIKSLKDSNALPRFEATTIWPGKDEWSFETSVDCYRILMPVVFEMQSRLNKPIEIHHIMAAIGTNCHLPLAINPRLIQSDAFLDLIERSLRQAGPGGLQLQPMSINDVHE